MTKGGAAPVKERYVLCNKGSECRDKGVFQSAHASARTDLPSAYV